MSEMLDRMKKIIWGKWNTSQKSAEDTIQRNVELFLLRSNEEELEKRKRKVCEGNVRTDSEIVDKLNAIEHMRMGNFIRPKYVGIVTKKHIIKRDEKEWGHRCPKCSYFPILHESVWEYFLLPYTRFLLWSCPHCGYEDGERRDTDLRGTSMAWDCLNSEDLSKLLTSYC